MTPTSTTSTARSEMSSRRLREMERSSCREPLTMSGRSSHLWCTPPSLADTIELTPKERSERARRDASARFEREKLRFSLPPPKVVAAAPPAKASTTKTQPSPGVEDLGDQPTEMPPSSSEDALFVLDESSATKTIIEKARDEIVDKIVWILLAEDDDVAARVCCVERRGHRWFLGVELLQPPPPSLIGAVGKIPNSDRPDRALFVPPASIALLNMQELLDLPPPPPPFFNDENRPPSIVPVDENVPPPPPPIADYAEEDMTPACLNRDGNRRIPPWADKDQLDRALREQEDPPPQLVCVTRTCSIVDIFNRPSLARREGRETSDWSKDDW